MSKSDASNAERAAEHYAREVLGCVNTVRAVRTRFQRQDLFGSDCLGICNNGIKVFLQATAGTSANVAHRRRKLEAIPWHHTDVVRLLEMRREKIDRRVEYRFRVHELYRWHTGNKWDVINDIPVPRAWFRAWRPE